MQMPAGTPETAVFGPDKVFGTHKGHDEELPCLKSVHEPDSTAPKPPSVTPCKTSTYSRSGIWTLRGTTITGTGLPPVGTTDLFTAHLTSTGLHAEYEIVKFWRIIHDFLVKYTARETPLHASSKMFAEFCDDYIAHAHYRLTVADGMAKVRLRLRYPN